MLLLHCTLCILFESFLVFVFFSKVFSPSLSSANPEHKSEAPPGTIKLFFSEHFQEAKE